METFFCACGSGMVESMLEPHLKGKADATQGDVGIAFFILGAVYMATSIMAGWVSFIHLNVLS